MQRKEVIVGGKVFNLGLKEFEEVVANRDKKLATLTLKIGPQVFDYEVSREDKTVILNWCGFTSMANIVWMRFVFIGFRWPPIKQVTCFTPAKEEAIKC